ncbi:MAG TPA: oligosaccharide flippase family protein [Vicinamibacterales bacterium]|nr:oligosaccharide flippase family protein [Vicinamibacterales bacterium]
MSTSLSSASRPSGRSFALATISAGSAALLLLLQTVAARLMSIDDFGRFGYALSVSLIAEALIDLGLHQATVRAIARDRREAATLFHNTLALKLVTATVVFGVLTAATFAMTSDPVLRTACIVMIASAALRSYLLSVRGVYLGLERFGMDAAIVVGDRVLLLAAGAAALWLGYGLVGLTLAFLLTRVIALALALLATSRDLGGARLQFDLVRWRQLQTEALPIGVFLLLLTVYSYADRIMLEALSTLEDVGLYGAAFTLYEGLAYAPAVLSSVLTPRLSALWREDRGAHRRLSRQGTFGAVALSVAVAIPLWFVGGPLLNLLFGTERGVPYAEATTAFRLLLAGLPCIFAIWILQAVAMSVFRERLLLKATAAGVVVNLVLNAMLIPSWGRDGAAAATLVSEAFSLLLLLYALRDVLGSGGTDRDGRPADADDGPTETSTEAFGNLESNLRFLGQHGVRTGRTLEIGTGRGALLAHLRTTGADAIGLDLHHGLLVEARTRHPTLPVVRASADRLPFPDEAFDTVLSFDVFEHVPDSDRHLAEVRRVLADGGRYLLQTPNKWTNTVFETVRWKSFTRWRADHCSLHTYGQLERRLARQGFAVTFADVPVVTPYFRRKVRQHLGWPGAALLAVSQPDRWPRRLRTNFYVRADKQRTDPG